MSYEANVYQFCRHHMAYECVDTTLLYQDARSGCVLYFRNAAVFCENMTFCCQNMVYIVSFLYENINYNLASGQS